MIELIIRMVLSIFGVVFEKDVDRRKREQERIAALQRMREEMGQEGGAPAPPSGQAQQQAQQQQAPPQQPAGFLAELFRELEAAEQEAQQQQQAQQQGQAPQRQRRSRRRKPEAPPPPPPQPKQETYAEALARIDKESSEFNRRVDEFMGVHGDEYKLKTEEAFKLPGETPLEQAIFAQVILGPCKARRHTHQYL